MERLSAGAGSRLHCRRPGFSYSPVGDQRRIIFLAFVSSKCWQKDKNLGEKTESGVVFFSTNCIPCSSTK
jgi:hypothetical protein